MSFIVTSLGSVGDTNARSAYTCPISAAPAFNDLVLVAAVVNTTGGAVEPTGVVGAGLVFSLVTSSVTFNPPGSTGAHNLSVWRSMAPAPSGSLITVTFPASANGCAILVNTVSGVSTSGTSGVNAIGGSSNSSVNGLSSVKVIGPSAVSTANAWWAVQSANSTEIAHINNSYQTIDTATFLTADTHIISAWTTLSTGTAVTFTASGVDDRGAVILELVLDNPAVVAAPASPGIQGRRLRIPEVPSQLTGILGTYLRQVARQLNAEAFISLFSGTDPNTSGFTGIPGNLLVNIGSASTWTRLWGQVGSVASLSTTSWHPFRIA